MKKLKIFLVLLAAALIGKLLGLPYLLVLTTSQVSLIMIFLSLFAFLSFYPVFIFCGLFLAQAVGFRMPFLRLWLYGEKTNLKFKDICLHAAIVGCIVGFVIVFCSILFGGQSIKMILQRNCNVPFSFAIKGLLASFYGAINEEIYLRLFVMSLLVWIFYKFSKNKNNPIFMWFSIFISSILFGLGHLPIALKFAPLSVWLVAKIVTLNGIAGVAFGWLYWKKGLESAMIAHFSADIILHVLWPAVVIFLARFV